MLFLGPLVVRLCNLVLLASIIPPFDTPRPQNRLNSQKIKNFKKNCRLFSEYFPLHSSIWSDTSSIEPKEAAAKKSSHKGGMYLFQLQNIFVKV